MPALLLAISTTLVGIILRLSHTRAAHLATKKNHVVDNYDNDNKNNNNDENNNHNIRYCSHRTMHGTARQMNYNHRIRGESFLFSMIRHPTSRIISEFFHFAYVGEQVEPTDEVFRNYAIEHGYRYYISELTTRNYMSSTSYEEYLRTQGFSSSEDIQRRFTKILSNSSTYIGNKDVRLIESKFHAAANSYGNTSVDTIIDDILSDYNFVGILERIDESLVVLQMLLNLTTKEILYTRTRTSGAFSNGWTGRPCLWVIQSFLTPGMEDFFNSPIWGRHIVKDDLRLYSAINASLDRTIEKLGKENVAKNLYRLKRGLQIAQNNCHGRVIQMCDEAGRYHFDNETTCYIWSEGCDHECINELNDTDLIKK